MSTGHWRKRPSSVLLLPPPGNREGGLKARAAVPPPRGAGRARHLQLCLPSSSSLSSPRGSARGPPPSGRCPAPGLVPTSRREQVQQAGAQPGVSGGGTALGRVAELGGEGRPGGWWRREGPGHQEASAGLERAGGPGRPPRQPTLHARHVHAACILLCQPPGRAHPCPEGKMAREEARGHAAWYEGKISRVDPISFATGHLPVGRLLRNTNGSISRNFLRVSSKLTLGRRGQRAGGGPALGTEEEREGGRPLPVAMCLSLGLLATCPPRSRACPPPSGRPGTASGLPGCS